MEQIELISVRAREEGMTYGQYIKKYPNCMEKPQPKARASAVRICNRCCMEFEPMRRKDGTLSVDKTCPLCRESVKAEKAKRKRRRKQIKDSF